MNGFMPPRFQTRKLLALALAGWMGQSLVHAQDDAPPAAPPAFPAELNDEPITVELTPIKRVAKPAKPVAKAQKTKPKTQVSRAVEASIWAEPEENLAPVPEQKPIIRQVQAAPDDLLGVAPDSVTGEPAADPAAPPLVDGELQAPAAELPPVEEAPLTEEVLPGQDSAPAVGQPLESVAEPVQFQNRPAQRMPANYEIDRTAATEDTELEDPAPYNGRAAGAPAGGFSADDEVHTVGAGESFWTISKKHYGMGRYSAALAEYNKARIPKPDKIKPGMKVIVPPVQILNAKYGRLIFGAAYDAMVAPPAPTGFFVDAQGHPMYRVGEKDNLSTIAETHLGRSTRWTEIVALNKQSLKNYDSLKLGTVLRLPDDASEAATK